MEVPANNENTDYKTLSYKIYFSDDDVNRSHVIDFLIIFGTLYDLLKDLVASKINITSTNADQMRFIVYSMMGYYNKDFFIEQTIYKEKSGSWSDRALNMAGTIL